MFHFLKLIAKVGLYAVEIDVAPVVDLSLELNLVFPVHQRVSFNCSFSTA